jgi:hypothetical protein
MGGDFIDGALAIRSYVCLIYDIHHPVEMHFISITA